MICLFFLRRVGKDRQDVLVLHDSTVQNDRKPHNLAVTEALQNHRLWRLFAMFGSMHSGVASQN